MDELAALLGGMSDDELQQLMGLSTIQGRMDQAQGLMDQPMGQHSTMLGGVLGGLGAGVGNFVGGQAMKGLRNEQQAQMLAIARLLQKPQQPAMASPMGDYDADDTSGLMMG